MGMDIMLQCDNWEELEELDEFYEIERRYGLSRSFCNLICRRDVVDEGVVSELDQIATICQADVSVVYAMTQYMDEEAIEELLEMEYEEDEHEEQRARFAEYNATLSGNIPRVIATLDHLIEQFGKITDLPQRLTPTNYDTIGIPKYFADFHNDPGDGYIGNNFGQDLRNLRHYAEYVKKHGAETVYFTFG